MKLYFVSGNVGKYLEVKSILAKHNIEVEHIQISKPEIDADEIEEIAKDSAEQLAKQLNKPIIIEDSGFFLKAFKNFPGPHAKFVIEQIGTEGIFKLVDGKTREGYFKCCAAYCEPNKEAKVFNGIKEGKVAKNLAELNPHPQMPYDTIFIPEGQSQPWADIMEIKNKDSHRIRAFNKLVEWIKTQS